MIHTPNHSERLRPEFHGNAALDFDTITFTILSSILACVALLTDSVPVLIGAMILAPTFDPLIAVPFGILTQDRKLLGQGVLSISILFGTAFLVCMITVWAFLQTSAIPAVPIFSRFDMLTERLTVGWHSVITALAAGAGGAIASASNRQSNLVGVVVALALVPSLASASIAFQTGRLSGWGGLALFGVNVGAIIIAGLIILFIRCGAGKIEDEMERNE